MSNRENFYDTEIAPKLKEIAMLCADNEISFSAVAQFGETLAETTILTDSPDISIILVTQAIQAQGNIDKLFVICQEYGKRAGHNSIILSMLGRIDDIMGM